MLPSYDTLQIKNIINKSWSGCICQVLLDENVFFTVLLPWLYHKTTIFQLCTTILYIFNIILIEKMLLYPTLCTQEISLKATVFTI